MAIRLDHLLTGCSSPIVTVSNRYIRVAHVYKVLRYNYLMIGIDGHTAEDASDCFCYHKSMCLPINWCKENRVSLKVPEDWDSAKFNYVTYLKSVKAIAAPRSLFDDKEPDHGFKKGMYVEAVDLVEPHLICPAQGRLVVWEVHLSYLHLNYLELPSDYC